jgi:hypothetical protein
MPRDMTPIKRVIEEQLRCLRKNPSLDVKMVGGFGGDWKCECLKEIREAMVGIGIIILGRILQFAQAPERKPDFRELTYLMRTLRNDNWQYYSISQ